MLNIDNIRGLTLGNVRTFLVKIKKGVTRDLMVRAKLKVLMLEFIWIFLTVRIKMQKPCER